MSSTRRRVLTLYKELHRLGRDYPDPKYNISISSNMCPPEAHLRHTATISTLAYAGCLTVCHHHLIREELLIGLTMRLCPW